MSITTCERCGKQVAKAEKCNTCNKLQCLTCIRSSKRVGKTRRYFICKDCWSNMRLRRQFKSK